MAAESTSGGTSSKQGDILFKLLAQIAEDEAVDVSDIDLAERKRNIFLEDQTADKENLHLKTEPESVSFLGSNSKKGLTTTEARKRLDVFGENKLSIAQPRRRVPQWEIQAGDEIHNLTHQCQVLRDGKFHTIQEKELTYGDIVFLDAGSNVPADIRILSTSGGGMYNEAAVDNSSLTGECELQICASAASPQHGDVNPLESRNLCFFGTQLGRGALIGVVFAVGDATIMGQIASLISYSSERERIPGFRASTLKRGMKDLWESHGIWCLNATSAASWTQVGVIIISALPSLLTPENAQIIKNISQKKRKIVINIEQPLRAQQQGEGAQSEGAEGEAAENQQEAEFIKNLSNDQENVVFLNKPKHDEVDDNFDVVSETLKDKSIVITKLTVLQLFRAFHGIQRDSEQFDQFEEKCNHIGVAFIGGHNVQHNPCLKKADVGIVFVGFRIGTCTSAADILVNQNPNDLSIVETFVGWGDEFRQRRRSVTCSIM